MSIGITYCHDDQCERAAACLRYVERLSSPYAWDSHCLTLRPIGARGANCGYFIAARHLPGPVITPETTHETHR